MPSYRVTIHDWHPASVNRLYGGHWTRRRKLKRDDAATILVSLAGVVPRALGRRRLNVTFIGMRGDIDNRLKSLLDGLVKAGLLIDDAPHFLELGDLRSVPGKPGTTIELTDIEETS